jgi:DNA (cytosine-5)-methyltransferase 1
VSVFYNDNEPYAAQWLRNLISAGHLPKGEVDERSIEEIQPDECGSTSHFFAGIGGWPYALRLAGWPDECPVWTGSCPCQPFSAAGKSRGVGDERHLWPAFRRLIAERRPTALFGEQVASKAGRLWLAGVRADLERMGYAVGAADLAAASVGAPHIRQRLYWVAYAECERLEGAEQQRKWEREQQRSRNESLSGGVGNTAGKRLQDGRERQCEVNKATSAWSDSERIQFSDGKSRRIEPGTFPLVAGIPKGMVRGSDSSVAINPQASPDGRVMRLRGYGNSIIPQVAAEFVMAFMESVDELRKESR